MRTSPVISMAGSRSSDVLAERELKDSFSIEYWEDRPFEGRELRRARYNLILLVGKGTGSLLIDDRRYAIGGNSLFLLGKGQVFMLEEGSHLEGYGLAFGDCFWEKAPASASNCKAVLFNDLSAHQQILVSEMGLEELRGLFGSLYDEFQKDDYPNKLDALAAYLKIIMIKIANTRSALKDEYNDHERRLYRQFVALLAEQAGVSREVAGYARALGVSAHQLAQVCRRYAGRSPKEVIFEQLLSEAKRLLQFSSKPVKEIAYELGFVTPEQFNHFFKKQASLSPNRYRSLFLQTDR